MKFNKPFHMPLFFFIIYHNKKGSLDMTAFVGLLGFEPRKTGPESVVLPLHHNPIRIFPPRKPSI